ncbi:MAG: SEC-C metal-binding domain-containing protein [Bryobacteraceae bacterium]
MSSDQILTPQQQQVVNRIASGSTATAAAEAAGVHRNTVGNWLRLPAFRQALNDAHLAQSLYWREQAELLASDALQALKNLLQNPSVGDSVRLKAALAILDRASAPLPAPPEAPPERYIEELHNLAQSSYPELVPPSVPQPFVRSEAKTGRNEPCPCGSGVKFKRCCLGKALQPAA